MKYRTYRRRVKVADFLIRMFAIFMLAAKLPSPRTALEAFLFFAVLFCAGMMVTRVVDAAVLFDLGRNTFEIDQKDLEEARKKNKEGQADR